MLRNLGVFERALLLSDQHSPFNVISVLRLKNAPAPEIMRKALDLIQNRQPLLRARIVDTEKKPIFARLTQPTLPFTVFDRSNETQWLEVVEHEMNTRLDIEVGPLFRVLYLYHAGEAEIILTFHHAIMDAASGMKLLDELLNTCSDLASGQAGSLPMLEVLPAVEERFPAHLKGISGLIAKSRYALSQMSDEVSYSFKSRGKRAAPVSLGGKGFPLVLTLPAVLVDAISRRCRKEKITLNSLFNATLLVAVNRQLYERRRIPMRTFSFADLRPYTKPPTPPEPLANYISMLRYTVTVSGEENIWSLAKVLHTKLYHSFKHSEKFLATRMSEMLMKMFISLKSMRMGNTALNYSGAVPLERFYGDIEVVGLHGFLSSFDLGPEVSSQARLYDDRLWFDFMFLDSDMDRSLAANIVDEINSILENAIQVA